jgi:hypothetical protein
VTAILDWLYGFLNKKSATASSVPDAARGGAHEEVPTTPLFRQQGWAGLRLWFTAMLIAHVDTGHIHATRARSSEDVADVRALGTRRCPISC